MTLSEYMELPYRMEVIPDKEEGGYAVTFPELPGCMTCGGNSWISSKQCGGRKKGVVYGCSFLYGSFSGSKKEPVLRLVPKPCLRAYIILQLIHLRLLSVVYFTNAPVFFFYCCSWGKYLRRKPKSGKSRLPDGIRYTIICKWSNRVAGRADLPFLQNGGDACEKSFWF